MSPETADTIRHAADVVQWINLTAAVLILAIALEFGRRWRQARPFLLGPASWGAHSVVFYAFALSGSLNGPTASLWSAIRVLHVSLMLLALLVAAFAIMLSPTPPDGYEGEADG